MPVDLRHADPRVASGTELRDALAVAVQAVQVCEVVSQIGFVVSPLQSELARHWTQLPCEQIGLVLSLLQSELARHWTQPPCEQIGVSPPQAHVLTSVPASTPPPPLPPAPMPPVPPAAPLPPDPPPPARTRRPIHGAVGTGANADQCCRIARSAIAAIAVTHATARWDARRQHSTRRELGAGSATAGNPRNI